VPFCTSGWRPPIRRKGSRCSTRTRRDGGRRPRWSRRRWCCSRWWCCCHRSTSCLSQRSFLFWSTKDVSSSMTKCESDYEMSSLFIWRAKVSKGNQWMKRNKITFDEVTLTPTKETRNWNVLNMTKGADSIKFYNNFIFFL